MPPFKARLLILNCSWRVVATSDVGCPYERPADGADGSMFSKKASFAWLLLGTQRKDRNLNSSVATKAPVCGATVAKSFQTSTLGKTKVPPFQTQRNEQLHNPRWLMSSRKRIRSEVAHLHRASIQPGKPATRLRVVNRGPLPPAAIFGAVAHSSALGRKALCARVYLGMKKRRCVSE